MFLTTRVLRFRLKDKHAMLFCELAREVNFVWNYVNELSQQVWQRERRFLSGYHFHPFTRGAGKAGLNLHSQTLRAIGEEYVVRRKQADKPRLRWRVSGGPRRSLGWIPFKASAIRFRNGQVFFAGMVLSLWDSYGLSKYEPGAGNISEDARGRWYLNVTVKVKQAPKPSVGQVEKSYAAAAG